MTGLPIPPPGAWWEVHGTPTAPWVWSSEIVWQHDANGFAVSASYIQSASAGDAYAHLRWQP